MNKQEAIERIKNIDTLNINDMITSQKVDMVIKNQVLDIISQIDEPQKVVVPKFVAEWVGWCKTNNATLLGGISPIDELGSAVCNDKRVESLTASRWAIRNQDTFARAWLDGYEIEKEKLYTVEIPNPNDKYCMNALKRLPSGKIKLVSLHRSNTRYFKNEEYQLTESEIKQDFEWVWKWAEPVEE